MTLLPDEARWNDSSRYAGDADHLPVVLRDSGTALLRPLQRDETEPLLDVFEQLSPASRLSRYLVPLPRLNRTMTAALADVDGCRHVAWLAVVEGRPAGIARAIRTSSSSAEVAFEVADRHQGRGLGTLLLDTVTTVAAARGVRRLEATALPDNEASVRVLRRLGLGWVAAGGLLEGSGPLRLLDPAQVDRRAVLALADQRWAVSRSSAPVPAVPPVSAPDRRGTFVMKVSATDTSDTMPMTV